MIRRSVELQLTVEELAREFASLDANEQAAFFVLASAHFSEWSLFRREQQLSFIAHALRGTSMDAGAEFVRTLAIYLAGEEATDA